MSSNFYKVIDKVHLAAYTFPHQNLSKSKDFTVKYQIALDIDILLQGATTSL